MKVVRNNMRKLRLEMQVRLGRDIPLTEIARAIGVTRAALSAIEMQKSQPSSDTLVLLCDYFGVDIGDMLEIVDMGDSLTRYAVRPELLAA